MKPVEGNSISGNHFIERASWTLVDQFIVSGGNFLLMVLLARSLSEEDYGEFALFLGAIFLLRTIGYSFISYPLSVRLCVANDDERARLLGNTVVLTVALSLVLVMLMALGTAQLVLVRVQLFSWLLAAIAGIAATASFQAGLNIAGE